MAGGMEADAVGPTATGAMVRDGKSVQTHARPPPRSSDRCATLALSCKVWLQQCPPVACLMPPAHDCTGDGVADSEHLSVKCAALATTRQSAARALGSGTERGLECIFRTESEACRCGGRREVAVRTVRGWHYR